MPTQTITLFDDLEKALATSENNAIWSIQDPIEWIQNNFYLYDRNELIKLYDCQIRPLRLAFERDSKGHYRFNTVLWSWPKKSAKSTVVAAVVDYIAWNRPKSSIKLIANDLEQADSRVGAYLRENLRLGTRKDRVKIKPSGYRIEYDNQSIVNMIPIDPSGEAGGNDDLLVYSELWGWKSKAHQKMWSEMTLSPNKYGNSQRWIDTYAGQTGESPILEMLYETGVKQGKRVWDDLEVYINEPAKLLCVWITQHLLPWQISEEGVSYYGEQESTLTPNEFRRMHKNEWTSSEESFIPLEWWNACRQQLPKLEEYQPCVMAVDAAVSGDTFSVIVVSGREDGEKYDVRYARCWYPPKGGKIDYQGTQDNPGPELEIRRLIDEFNISEICYDEYQLHDFMNRMKRDLIVHTFAFPQGADRLISDKQLQDKIKARNIGHSGEPDLSEHIQNANCKTEGEKLRIVKRTESKKIDLAVCLSMATERARHWGL